MSADIEYEDLERRWGERIAEMEAENARLQWMESTKLATLMRERDEARTQYQNVSKQLLAKTTALTEARAACAAKDEALQTVDAWAKGSADTKDELWDHASYGVAKALSSTAGAELLARLEKAEREVACLNHAFDNASTDHAAQLVAMTARAEKAEAELKTTKTCLFEMQNASIDLAAQLEAMRAALERIKGVIEYVKPHGFADALKQLDAALSPSAPRHYRNQVLEEAAKWFEGRQGIWSEEAVARDIRALKDTEDGT